jgi:glutamine---fructose-6-phosphate transaminase (isomerizing)
LRDFSIIEGPYLRDILSQPRALQDTLQRLENSPQLEKLAKLLNRGQFQRIVLTGMGASLHALYPITLELVDHGFTALMVDTSELIHYQRSLLDRKTLIIAVSQSGQSAEIVRLLAQNRGFASLIAVTNNSDSLLAQRADAVVQTFAGDEFSVSCKTYVTALMGLKWLGDLLCKKDLRRMRQELKRAVAACSTYLSTWETHARSLMPKFEDIANFFLVGRGASLAAVSAGALIIKESTHVPAEGMSSASFRHGPFDMLSSRTFVLVFAGEARTRQLNRKLLQDIREQHASAEIVGEKELPRAVQLPAVPGSVRSILEILPVQMATLALGLRDRREPGRFSLLSKITTVE